MTSLFITSQALIIAKERNPYEDQHVPISFPKAALRLVYRCISRTHVPGFLLFSRHGVECVKYMRYSDTVQTSTCVMPSECFILDLP